MSLWFSRDDHLARAAGLFPHKCDWTAARYWFERSARQGYLAAANNIGVISLNGKPRAQGRGLRPIVPFLVGLR